VLPRHTWISSPPKQTLLDVQSPTGRRENLFSKNLFKNFRRKNVEDDPRSALRRVWPGLNLIKLFTIICNKLECLFLFVGKVGSLP
jgi:hypothetical protein